jgi:predicted GIY-YIG superfamily endonuclease
MIFVYVLQSAVDGRFYVGLTNDLQRRLSEHNRGKMKYTKAFRPWIIIFHEPQPDYPSARKREKYFKSAAGRRWIQKLILSGEEE